MILALQEHSALHPASTMASGIHRMYVVFLVVSGAVYVLVIAAMLFAARRRRSAEPAHTDNANDAGASRAVLLATSVTVAVLFTVLVYDLALGRTFGHRAGHNAFTIIVTGHQWWWDVEYQDTVPQNYVHTANEIHIPVGQVVVLKVQSHDVIHSFWAPSLGVKQDLIPGHPAETRLEADRPGRYKVLCAEFCGLQHAKMSLDIVAEDLPAFQAWLSAQRSPAPTPTDSLVARGRTVLESGNCALCHNVTGTLAGGRLGPDLTHVASRLSLAAGALPNAPGPLAGWIVDAQSIKPGVLMPQNRLAPADLRSLLAYIATLR